MSNAIPAFYRFYFKWSDPIVCLWTVWANFAIPDTVIDAFVPASTAQRNPYFDFQLQQLAGAYLALAFTSIVLLRYTSDVNIWKIWVAAILLLDCLILYSIAYALSQQGRLGFSALRLEDWGSIIITVQAMIVRPVFLLGVGLSKDDKVTKKA